MFIFNRYTEEKYLCNVHIWLSGRESKHALYLKKVMLPYIYIFYIQYNIYSYVKAVERVMLRSRVAVNILKVTFQKVFLGKHPASCYRIIQTKGIINNCLG